MFVPVTLALLLPTKLGPFLTLVYRTNLLARVLGRTICQFILQKSNPYNRAEALKPTLAFPLKRLPTTHHEAGRALLFTFVAPLHILLSGLAVAGIT